MARRVPVLRDDDVLERRRQRVDDRNDFVAALHRQRAAVEKAVLHVHHDQRRLGAGLDLAGREGVESDTAEATGQPEGCGGFHEGSAMHGVDSRG